MKLVFAQGNPGTDFTRSRHNIGFHILDEFASSHGVSFQLKDKFEAEIGELQLGDQKILLAKPTTFYNETGPSARAIVDYYKLNTAQDVLVIHDELALPFGTLRTRGEGSDAGNNGIKSLTAHLGSQYHRLRIGIWNEIRERAQDKDFVLGKFTSEEHAKLVENITPKAIEIINAFIAGVLEPSSHSV